MSLLYKNINELESMLATKIQTHLEISDNIFSNIATELEINEQDVIDILSELKRRKIIRNISAILDPKKSGYHSTLVAFKVNKNRIKQTARVINQHQGVSHNYLREHAYNIWFTLAVPQTLSLESEIEKIAADTNPEDYLVLPSEKRLKLKFTLPGMHETERIIKENKNISEDKIITHSLTNEEKTILQILQKDLPLCRNPFQELLNNYKLNIEKKVFYEISNNLLKMGFIRRYSAILNQYNYGFENNALVAWKISTHELERINSACSENQQISHAYIRKIVPGKWDYPLFTMIHAKSSEELETIITDFKAKCKISNYLILKSLQEFKKRPVKYFS